MGCCGWHSEWNLPELIFLVNNGEENFVRFLLNSDIFKKTIRKKGMVLKVQKATPPAEKCFFHNREKGCTLNNLQRPILCRLFYCNHKELPADIDIQLRAVRTEINVLIKEWEVWLHSQNVTIENITIAQIKNLPLIKIPSGD